MLKQWFIKVKPLAQKALKAIEKKEVRFTAKRYEKIAIHWLKNLRDWNISRQIVWGMQIPAYRCEKCLEWTITDGKKPTACSCGNKSFTQDPDTFDTWFSSAQWPYATLKTTKNNDFEYFYPTSLMETGFDIIPFWVIRMIMLGLFETKKVPFKEVLIHGLVRDQKGQKISKSKGNVVNPLKMVEKYGADALRMSLLWGALVENDSALSEENIKGQRNFANKLWNIARFALGDKPRLIRHNKKPRRTNNDDRWIHQELQRTTKKVTALLEKYRLNEAAEEIYDFVWNRFANTYLESSKNRRQESQDHLEYVLEKTLKLLHPLMPFITEALWQRTFAKSNSDLLISTPWPI